MASLRPDVRDIGSTINVEISRRVNTDSIVFRFDIPIEVLARVPPPRPDASIQAFLHWLLGVAEQERL